VQELKENERVPLRDYAATTTKLGEVPPQMPLISYGSTKGYCKENRRVLEENDNVLE
jgi:hypothetical protein